MPWRARRARVGRGRGGYTRAQNDRRQVTSVQHGPLRSRSHAPHYVARAGLFRSKNVINITFISAFAPGCRPTGSKPGARKPSIHAVLPVLPVKKTITGVGVAAILSRRLPKMCIMDGRKVGEKFDERAGVLVGVGAWEKSEPLVPKTVPLSKFLRAGNSRGGYPIDWPAVALPL